jgi:hypothetical protein
MALPSFLGIRGLLVNNQDLAAQLNARQEYPTSTHPLLLNARCLLVYHYELLMLNRSELTQGSR